MKAWYREGARPQPSFLGAVRTPRPGGHFVRRLLLVLVTGIAAMGALLAPASASAHPLGNFTVNHFAAIDLAGNAIYVRYALDLAEIPTFQEGADVRRPGLCRRSRPEAGAHGRRSARAARASCRTAPRSGPEPAA